MRCRVRVRAGIVAKVLVLSLSATSVASAGGDSGAKKAPRFADGVWSGEVIYAVAADFPGDLSVDAIVDQATFELQVTGGSVSGSLHGVGTGIGLADFGAAAVDIGFDASIDGDAAAPELTPETFRIKGTASIQGIEVPIDQTFSGGSFPSSTFEIKNASCDAVGGSFEQQVEAALASAGATPTQLTAYWFAIRQSESIGEASQALSELMNAANQILTGFQQTGTLDASALYALVKQAESFALSLKKNTACGIVEDPDTFALAITGIVKQMLTLAFGPYVGKFSASQLGDLLFVGVATGAIGAGAADQAYSDKLLADAKNAFTALIDEAVSDGSKSALQDILEIAIAMGWSDLQQEAAKALEKL